MTVCRISDLTVGDMVAIPGMAGTPIVVEISDGRMKLRWTIRNGNTHGHSCTVGARSQQFVNLIKRKNDIYEKTDRSRNG